MAGVIDVQNALVTLIGTAFAPGTAVKYYPGWPNAEMLGNDIILHIPHITVFPRQDEKNTTRFAADWQSLTIAQPTLTLTISGQTVIVGGVMPSPFIVHNMALLVSRTPYTYAVKSTDSLTSIATALAALIPGASSVNSTITISGVIGAARVGITGTAMRELRRQNRSFQVTIWADTPQNRDALSAALDGVFAPLRFLTLADGSAARIIYGGSLISDSAQKAQLYRCDMIFHVEYATTQTETETAITVDQLNAGTKIDGTAATVSTTTYS